MGQVIEIFDRLGLWEGLAAVNGLIVLALIGVGWWMGRARRHDPVRIANGAGAKLDAIGDRLTEIKSDLKSDIRDQGRELSRLRGIATRNGELHAASNEAIRTTSGQITKLFEKIDRGDEERHHIAEKVDQLDRRVKRVEGRVGSVEDTLTGLECRKSGGCGR